MNNNNTASNPPTVLAVNDDASVLRLLCALLEREGYKVLTADNGLRALELARTIEPDIVISDVVMPEMDGLEFCRRIKQDSHTAFIPILLASAERKAEGDSLNALVAGADDYLEMPFRAQELLVKVARLTERHRVERRYREIVEEAADIIYTRDMQGNITSINEAGARFFGRSAADLVGSSLSSLIGAEAADQDIAETIASQSDAPLRSVHCLKNGRGEMRYLEAVLTLVHDAEGQTIGVRGVVRDITEREQTENALRESERRLREMLENIRLIALMLDAKGNLTFCNDFLLRLTGWQREEAIGENWFDVFVPELVRESVKRMFAESMSRGDIPVHFENEIQTRTGERHLVSWNNTLMRNHQGEVIGTTSIGEDITERKRAEQVLTQQVEREALINRISSAVHRSLDMTEVFRTATRELGRALSASRVHLHLYDPAQHKSPVKHEYVAPNVPSIKQVEVSFEDPIGQWLLRSTHAIVIGDALAYEGGTPEFNEAVRTHAALAGVRSQINFPVVVNSRFRGALCIHQTDRPRHWKEEDVALVEAVATQLATGIARAELFEMVTSAKKEWETTFDAMSDGIFIFDNAGMLLRVNRAGASLEDTWPHLLMGRHCCDILRVNGEDLHCIIEKTVREGQSVTMEITPERLNRPLLVTVEPIIEFRGQTAGAVCTARDLSELRKIEAMARERQSLLTNILESAREPIFAIDTKGYFLWLNSASTTTSGYAQEDLIGHHFLELLHAADREVARENFESALRGEPQSYEVRFHRRDGEALDMLFYNAPLIIDGSTTGVLGIASDITEQKQQRQRAAQADKLRALGQLASGVAHDFNNALAAILGRTQLIRRQTNDAQLARNLDIIQTAAEDAAATVRRIQTFARRPEGDEFITLDATSLLRDAVEITRTRWENEARMRGLRYDVELDAAQPFYTYGNASELREVFVNLIVNAVDAMPQGGRLLISCERNMQRLRLRFADTGMGMTDEVRERIFEPFYTTKGMNGTGLGLAVSYGIIERHEGSISVESEMGRGTIFEIDLPSAATNDAHAPVNVRANEAEESSSLSVLVVDDEPFVRDTLAEMLTVLAHKVVSTSSGREALERLAAQHFDLVFTDLSMPEMDGWEVAREIRRRFGTSMTVVLVTGYGKSTVPPTGEKNLINAVIGKPFDFAQVAETISAVIAG